MKRIFTAVKINPEPELLKAFSDLKNILAGEIIKWTDISNTHLTLAFLGDTDEKKIRIIKMMLEEKCSELKEFEFILSGLGLFRNYRDPRVIWAGISSSGSLTELNDKIREGLKETGFIVENRPFSPHLTLGRIKLIKDTVHLREVIEEYRDTEFQIVKVRDVVLFESILMQTGSVYKQLGRFGLL